MLSSLGRISHENKGHAPQGRSLSPSQPEPGAGGQGPGGGQGRLPRRQAVQLTPAVGNRPRNGPSRRREEQQADCDKYALFHRRQKNRTARPKTGGPIKISSQFKMICFICPSSVPLLFLSYHAHRRNSIDFPAPPLFFTSSPPCGIMCPSEIEEEAPWIF